MAIFTLKKYEDTPEQDLETKPEVTPVETEGEVKTTDGLTEETKQVEEETSNELSIHVSGSIAGIVAAALDKVLLNKSIKVEVKDDATDEEKALIYARAISTEDINNNPLDTFKSIQKDEALFIATEGFNTKEEEWFLSNLSNKTDKVYYSVESFLGKILKDFLK